MLRWIAFGAAERDQGSFYHHNDNKQDLISACLTAPSASSAARAGIGRGGHRQRLGSCLRRRTGAGALPALRARAVAALIGDQCAA